MGQHMLNAGTIIKKTKTGFTQTITKYSAANCSNCPLNSSCHKSKTNRVIEINHTLNALKKEAEEKLQNEMGIYHRKKRGAGCEGTEKVI
ncbi:MAG: transposase [Sphingobacteriales bacterium]|nr:transposase [Sphingobacteriales bacterium]